MAYAVCKNTEQRSSVLPLLGNNYLHTLVRGACGYISLKIFLVNPHETHPLYMTFFLIYLELARVIHK